MWPPDTLIMRGVRQGFGRYGRCRAEVGDTWCSGLDTTRPCNHPRNNRTPRGDVSLCGCRHRVSSPECPGIVTSTGLNCCAVQRLGGARPGGGCRQSHDSSSTPDCPTASLWWPHREVRCASTQNAGSGYVTGPSREGTGVQAAAAWVVDRDALLVARQGGGTGVQDLCRNTLPRRERAG